jgi:hypothetical protein
LQNLGVDQGTCTDDGAGEARCDLGDIAAGGDRSISLTLQATAAGKFVGDVAVAADNDADTGNNSVQAAFDIKPVPPQPDADVEVACYVPG